MSVLCVKEEEERGSLLRRFKLEGQFMSLEHVVLPDVSDSDGHSGPGIQHFHSFQFPLAWPSLP